jgi:hypothetical protein
MAKLITLNETLRDYESNNGKEHPTYKIFVDFAQKVCENHKTFPYILFWVCNNCYRPFENLEDAVNYPDSKLGYVQCDFVVYELKTLTKQRFYECRNKHRCLIFNTESVK